jgi:hypothetical protein
MPSRAAFAFIGLLVLAASTFAKDAVPNAVGAAMADAATAFLASLDDSQRAEATLPFDDPRRLDWHNIPKPDRKGLPLSEMSTAQQQLCHALLRAALSEAGYEKATRILALENNLREGERGQQGAPVRDPARYYLAIFGEPASAGGSGGSGPWGWCFEGHHFSLNFVINDGIVTADTPNFWGANPATVKTFVDGGPEVGVRTLADEEQLAFDLLASLDDAQRAKAVIADKAPADYRGPGTPQPPHEAAAGLAAADMNETQRETLHKLLATYCGHLADDIAAARLESIETAGIENIRFAWLGAQQPGIGHAYRIQGPTFLLELVNIQSDPQGNPANHIHSVWRSLEGDFGVH